MLMKKFIFTIVSLSCLSLAVHVNNAQAASQNDAMVATFDDLSLEPESHWRGDETSDEPESVFRSGGFLFDNYLWAEYDFWGKFAYSNETSTTYASLDDQFHSAVGHGAEGSSIYGVAYVADAMFGPGSTCFYVADNAEGDSISGCYITNSAWGKDAVINGDGMSSVPGPFATGDYFSLTATGTRADGTTASLDFYLADYRSENSADHYCLDTWEWFDLRPLGKVTKVSFSMNSTKSNDYGISTPTYFCIDNIDGVRPLREVEPIEIVSYETTLNLDDYFSFADEEASVNYAIADAYDESLAALALDGASLKITAVADGELPVVVTAVQKGHREYVSLPLVIKTTGAAPSVALASIKVYPVPASTHVTVALPASAYDVELIGTDGTLLRRLDGVQGNVEIPVATLPNGVYFVRISDGNDVVVKRIVKVNR